MAVTLIVVAVPEGLPMSVTLSLVLNIRRMCWLRIICLVKCMLAKQWELLQFLYLIRRGRFNESDASSRTQILWRFKRSQSIGETIYKQTLYQKVLV